ncbi:MAG TPA: type 4a pilus biogenesis protein PilO [Vicinamibacterales bacterium]
MLRRILTEQRTFVLILGIVLAINVGVYAAVVYPLSVRVGDADARAFRAEETRRAAQREYQAARGIAAGKERAEAELQTFYRDILPSDLSAAHRLTYLNLAQLARKSNLRIQRRTATPGHVRGGSLDVFTIVILLEGNYEDIRQFIYNLEAAPEFVAIESVAIDQGHEASGSLALTLQLVTYYRVVANAG